MATIGGSFALAVSAASVILALGGSPARGESASPANSPARDEPRYLDGIDRRNPPPSLALQPRVAVAPAVAPSASPSAYAWGPPTFGSSESAADDPPEHTDRDDAWSLRCEERVCFVQFVPGDFETVSSRRFAVNLGWSPSVGRFELEARFLAGAIGAEIRAISVEANGRQTALLPFVRCNERGTCWHRALLTDDQVERLTSALVLALVPLESHDRPHDELQVSAAGLRGTFARLREAAPEAAAGQRGIEHSPSASAPPAAYTSPSLDESRSIYLPRVTGPTR